MNSAECRLCGQTDENKLVENESFYAILDNHPVTPGHTLIATRRHVVDIFGLSALEFAHLQEILERTKAYLDDKYSPAGYNIGANCGNVAGQTIFHFHLHVFPRYRGDVPNPRGGIRNFKPPLVAY